MFLPTDRQCLLPLQMSGPSYTADTHVSSIHHKARHARHSPHHTPPPSIHHASSLATPPSFFAFLPCLVLVPGLSPQPLHPQAPLLLPLSRLLISSLVSFPFPLPFLQPSSPTVGIPSFGCTLLFSCLLLYSNSTCSSSSSSNFTNCFPTLAAPSYHARLNALLFW